MVLLSFSVKEEELRAGTKIRTTRLYNERKYRYWKSTTATKLWSAPGMPRLQGWWKPRIKGGYKIFARPGRDLYRLQFRDLNGRPWPFRERDGGIYTPMTTDEVRQYLYEEGFDGQLECFIRFFEHHYAPLNEVVFQSIAFPPKVI